MTRRLSTLLLLLLLGSMMIAPATAQTKAKVDLRTRQRTQTTDSLNRAQLGTIFNAENPLPLMRHATPVGRSEIERFTVDIQPFHDRDLSRTLQSATPTKIDRALNGTAHWIQGSLGSAKSFAKKGSALASNRSMAEQVAIGAVEQYRGLTRLASPARELQLMSAVTDELGFQHTRMQQTYDGIPLWGCDLYVHVDARGEVYCINGAYEPTPTGATTTPTLTDVDALTRTINDLQVHGRWAPLPADAAELLQAKAPRVQLVLYPNAWHQVRLVYEVTICASLTESWQYLVDARSGEVIQRLPLFCSIDHQEAASSAPPRLDGVAADIHAKPGVSLSSAAGFVDATGLDLNGQSRNFRAYQHGSGTFYSIADYQSYNSTKSQLPDKVFGGARMLTAQNKDLVALSQLSNVTSTNNSWSDRTVASVANNMRQTYDYYRNTFSRKAIDDNDATILSVMHVTRNNVSMGNAFWNFELGLMAYGDGDANFKPLAGSLDVAGHEMTHGIVAHTANLVYLQQAGALNESFADVFGIMVDRSNFLLGEEITRPEKGIALRDLANPANPNVLSPQPAHMNSYNNLPDDQDHGGVHVNSGIPNKAAHLMIQAIGREKTEQIYYRALSKYLTRNSNFVDCRKAIEQAAKDLHGDNSPEFKAAGDAFTAVGIGSSGGTNGGDNDVPSQDGGREFIAFMTADGSIGMVDVVTGQAATFTSAAAKARVTTSPNGQDVDRCQLSVTRTGSAIWFVNTSGKLAFVSTTTGEVSVFNDLKIDQTGDIWNASISPDGNYAALGSAYPDDPTIYITNGTVIAPVELKIASTQTGFDLQVIRYVDVMSWSPNMEEPRIAFDARCAINVGGEDFFFWSMYELDFESKFCYPFIPIESQTQSIGNITVGNTNPDLYAYNVLYEDLGVRDIAIVDYDVPLAVALGLPFGNFGGVLINDADRPSFSPDDNILCFSNQSTNSLLFVTGTQLVPVTFPEALFNPKWFLAGGSAAAVDDPSTGSTGLLQVVDAFPNPIRSMGTARIELPAPASVTMTLHDPLGRQVRTIMEGPLESGVHDIHFSAAELPSGTYFIWMNVDGMMRVKPVVVAR